MTESLQLRIVRTVIQAARRLTASEVSTAIVAADKDAKPNSIMASLGLLSQGNAGPLNKKRNDGGVLEYGVLPGFDIKHWIDTRKGAPVRAPKHTPDSASGHPSGDEAAEVIRVILKAAEAPDEADRRLTGDEIYENGNFTDRRTLFLKLSTLCEDGQPLQRERIDSFFYYWIRPGFDIEAWLKEHGDAPATSILDTFEIPKFEKPKPAPLGTTRPPPRFIASSSSAAAPPVEAKTATAPADLAAASSEEGAGPAAAAPEEHGFPAHIDRHGNGHYPRTPELPSKNTSLGAAATVRELLRHAHGELLEAAEASNDPKVAARARRVRLLNELREEFEATS